MTFRRRPLPVRPRALIGALLLVGCAPPPVTADTGADETETDESGAETDECLVPTDDTRSSLPQTIVLTNVGDQPIFLVPDSDCGDSIFHDLFVDGSPVEDDVQETCSTLATHACDSCDESNFGRAPIRIDPGASHNWPFDGYLYEIRSFPSECEFMAACWSGEDCPVGINVATGTMIEAELMTSGECLAGEDCECPTGQSACELPLIPGSSTDFGDLAPLSFEFTYLGAEMPVVELGG